MHTWDLGGHDPTRYLWTRYCSIVRTYLCRDNNPLPFFRLNRSFRFNQNISEDQSSFIICHPVKADGIVFMLDAADPDRFPEAKRVKPFSTLNLVHVSEALNFFDFV